MKIRSITLFANLTTADIDSEIRAYGTFLKAAAAQFDQASLPVQTRRLASQPFAHIVSDPAQVPDFALQVQNAAAVHDISYVSLGPVMMDDDPAYLGAIPRIFAQTDRIFASAEISTRASGVDLTRIRQVAELVQVISRISADGWKNLYFTALANCPPGSPFFPVAYHDSSEPHFALAIQAADLAVEVFTQARTPQQAQQMLTAEVEAAAARLEVVARQVTNATGMRFSGLDFSLAPYPGAAESLGGALEKLGITLGGAGGTAAAALLMTALDAARFTRTGFSGLMLPVLEDSVLAQRAAEGALHINDMLLYSAICGTGLDTVPLPGDTSAAALAGILADTGALALRLDKALTARLMPLPGRVAGDESGFGFFEFFAPGRVMAAPAAPSGGILAGSGTFRVDKRSSTS